jgi:hypothetical protein
MSIHKTHPTVLAFKKNEVETLEWIFTRRLVKDFSELNQKIEFTYYNFKDRDKLRNTDFTFHADFNMIIQEKIHRVILGANIRGDFELASYFMAICGGKKSLSLIRKFHFDYANPKNRTKQPVPIFHMQYGGGSTTEMKDLGISDKKIDNWLSVPRLNCTPINLAILLDITFCEFRTEETRKIIENPEWKSLIKKNEELLVRPYYKSISDFSTSQDYTSTHLIRDYCYGQ